MLGVVEANGEIAFLPERVGVTQAFAAAARSYGAPEARFRFSAPCCRSACGQWNGDGCSIAAQAAVLAERPAIAADPRSPPHCSIREICQWFSERGEAVCRTCRFVITERRDNPSL
ncbi:MAG: hypothetical protein HXY30_17920 [Pseudorhodoplanes sp.]|nr:hypothetical protein [Pseudorhodoplanes sp.]